MVGKTAQVGAYQHFTKEYIKPLEEQRRGRVISMEEAINCAQGPWAQLSEEAKSEWKQRSKRYKETPEYHEEKKLTKQRYIQQRAHQPPVLGKSGKKNSKRHEGKFAEEDAQKSSRYYDGADCESLRHKRERDRRDITQMLEFNGPPICASKQDRIHFIKEQRITIMSSTAYLEYEHEFWPAEFSVVKFRLSGGFNDAFTFRMTHGFDSHWPNEEMYGRALEQEAKHGLPLDQPPSVIKANALYSDDAYVLERLHHVTRVGYPQPFIHLASGSGDEYNVVNGGVQQLIHKYTKQKHEEPRHDLAASRFVLLEDLIFVLGQYVQHSFNTDDQLPWVKDKLNVQSWMLFDKSRFTFCDVHWQKQVAFCAEANAKKYMYGVFDILHREYEFEPDGAYIPRDYMQPQQLNMTGADSEVTDPSNVPDSEHIANAAEPMSVAPSPQSVSAGPSATCVSGTAVSSTSAHGHDHSTSMIDCDPYDDMMMGAAENMITFAPTPVPAQKQQITMSDYLAGGGRASHNNTNTNSRSRDRDHRASASSFAPSNNSNRSQASCQQASAAAPRSLGYDFDNPDPKAQVRQFNYGTDSAASEHTATAYNRQQPTHHNQHSIVHNTDRDNQPNNTRPLLSTDRVPQAMYEADQQTRTAPVRQVEVTAYTPSTRIGMAPSSTALHHQVPVPPPNMPQQQSMNLRSRFNAPTTAAPAPLWQTPNTATALQQQIRAPYAQRQSYALAQPQPVPLSVQTTELNTQMGDLMVLHSPRNEPPTADLIGTSRMPTTSALAGATEHLMPLPAAVNQYHHNRAPLVPYGIGSSSASTVSSHPSTAVTSPHPYHAQTTAGPSTIKQPKWLASLNAQHLLPTTDSSAASNASTLGQSGLSTIAPSHTNEQSVSLDVYDVYDDLDRELELEGLSSTVDGESDGPCADQVPPQQYGFGLGATNGNVLPPVLPADMLLHKTNTNTHLSPAGLASSSSTSQPKSKIGQKPKKIPNIAQSFLQNSVSAVQSQMRPVQPPPGFAMAMSSATARFHDPALNQ